jgi:hypothetical protein
MKIVNAILNLDRRIIYSIVGFFVVIPLLFPFKLPIVPTPEVEGLYNYIEGLPEGSHVLLAADFDPASKPELFPMLNAMIAHCFEKNHKVHLLTLWPGGPALMQEAIEDQASIYKKVDGTDYAYLGFKAGGAAVILGLTGGITGTYSTDHYGKPTASMPIYGTVSTLADMDYVVNIAAGATVEQWIAYGTEKVGVPMGASCTAVSAAAYYPYLGAGQLNGLSGGLKGTAEYEWLVSLGYPNIQGDSAKPRPAGDATKGMDAQSAVHILLVLSIILANVCYYIKIKNDLAERRS